MNKRHLKKDLLPYYEETDCCSWIVELRKENAELKEQVKNQKEVINKLEFIKNRKSQGASQENINKMAIELVNGWLKEVLE